MTGTARSRHPHQTLDVWRGSPILRIAISLRHEQCVADCATAVRRRRREGQDRPMPELYVNGAWVSAASGGRRTIHCPADGTLVAEVDEAGADDAARCHRRGVRRLPRRALADDLGARARRPAAAGRRPARARRRRGGAGRVARHRQAAGRERVRRRRRRLGVPPLRQGRRRGRRPGRRHRPRRRRQPRRARADRRLRADRAVELPAPPGLLEGRALPGRRQHVRAQAQRAHAAHRDPPDAPARGGRAARGRRQPRARRRADAAAPAGRATRASTWSRSPAAWPPAGG